MCCTLHPAKLSKTLIYAGDATKDGRYVHVLGYQNNATSKVNGPNAMILPIPASAPLGPQNVLDMRSHPKVLSQMAEAFQPRTKSLGARSFGTTRSVQIFKAGSYTVVLATDANEIPAALSGLSQRRQVLMNEAIFKDYAERYPGWHIALCIWEGSVQAEPLFWWYEPLAPNTLFYPGLDAHDGNPPNTDKDARRDHTLMTGSAVQPFGHSFGVDDFGPAQGLISKHGWGLTIDSSDFNRDYRVDVRYLRTLKIAENWARSAGDMAIQDISFDYYLPPGPLQRD